jgi:ABC-type transport system substrate-binding protein
MVDLPDSQAAAAFTGPTTDKAPQLKPELAERAIRVASETGLTLFYLGFNAKDKLVGQNRALRQAISSALNREEWIRAAGGAGIKATQAIPPGVADRLPDAGAKPATIKYDFDAERATALLKKAGYPEGKGLPELSLDLRGSDAAARVLGDFFQKQFAAAGLKLNVIYNTFPAFLEKLKQGNFQMEYGGWIMDYPDAANVFQLLYGPNRAPGSNETSFDHGELNKLYEQMAGLDPSPKRAALVQQMEAIVQEEVPWAMGFYPVKRTLMQPWLLNLRPADAILNRYKYVRVNRDVKKRFLEKK